MSSEPTMFDPTDYDPDTRLEQIRTDALVAIAQELHLIRVTLASPLITVSPEHGATSAGAMAEKLRKLVADEVFGPIVARAQARKDGEA